MNRSTTRSLCDIPKRSPLLARTSHKGWNAASLRSNSIINPISIYLINSISFDLVEMPVGWIYTGTLTPNEISTPAPIKNILALIITCRWMIWIALITGMFIRRISQIHIWPSLFSTSLAALFIILTINYLSCPSMYNLAIIQFSCSYGYMHTKECLSMASGMKSYINYG